MSFTLVVNNTNNVGNNNNTFQYKFLQGLFTIPEDSEAMVTNVQIPYSFYNITAAYGNNTCTLNFPTGASTYATYSITIPDGFYTTTSLNNYFQSVMISQGWYLSNSTSGGANLYWFSMNYNTYQYGNQITATPVPTALPAGYALPSNFAGFPTVSRCMYISIPALTYNSILGTFNGNIGTFLGFTASSLTNYPPAGTTISYSRNSITTPVGSTVNSIIIRCSLVSNKVGSPQDILDSFTIGGVSFGSNINYTSAVSKWVKLSAGSFSSFFITFCDQNLNPLNALDPNILCTILFRFPDKKLISA